MELINCFAGSYLRIKVPLTPTTALSCSPFCKETRRQSGAPKTSECLKVLLLLLQTFQLLLINRNADSGGSIWRPPPLNPFTQGMPEELIEPDLSEPKKGELSMT